MDEKTEGTVSSTKNLNVLHLFFFGENFRPKIENILMISFHLKLKWALTVEKSHKYCKLIEKIIRHMIKRTITNKMSQKTEMLNLKLSPLFHRHLTERLADFQCLVS